MAKKFVIKTNRSGKTVHASTKSNAKRVISTKRSKARKPVTAASVYSNGFGSYTPWSGAKDTWDVLEQYDKLDALEAFIDDAYYNSDLGEGLIDETTLNDLLWFEPEYVFEAVGLYYNAETDEVSDEPFEDDYDDIEENTHIIHRNRVTASSKSEKLIDKARMTKKQLAKEYGVSESAIVWKGTNKFIIVKDDEEIEVTASKKITASSDKQYFYGVPDVEFIWHNSWADPEISYQGELYNYFDLEEGLLNYYHEVCEETGIDDPNDEDFDKWVNQNPDCVYNELYDLTPTGSDNRTQNLSEVFHNMKPNTRK